MAGIARVQVENINASRDGNEGIAAFILLDLITSFEIFEHMLAPFNILRELKTDKLIASVPLKLWFTDAYWNDNNDWDKKP